MTIQQETEKPRNDIVKAVPFELEVELEEDVEETLDTVDLETAIGTTLRDLETNAVQEEAEIVCVLFGESYTRAKIAGSILGILLTVVVTQIVYWTFLCAACQ